MSTKEQRERAERDAKLFHDAWLALKTGYPSTADYWLAAETAAIERCAKICECHYDKKRPDFTSDPYITTLQCAATIRDLLPKEGE